MPLPFVANNDLFLVRVCCQAADQIAINDFCYKADLTSGTYTLPALVNDLDADFFDAYKNWLAANAAFYGISLFRVSIPQSGPFVSTNLRFGLDIASLMPRQAAALIAKKTAIAGRAGRGRVYIPFGGVDNVDADGHITAPGLALLQAIAIRTLTTQIYGGGGTTTTLIPMLFHRSTITADEVVDWTARVKIATQKRRGDYGRPNNLPW